MKLTFSNPRLAATIEDWPLGSGRRGPATFTVHAEGKKGERVSRTTTGKPKFTTYGERMCIVDGDNGKTYLLQYSAMGGAGIRIVSSDLQHDATTEETGRTSAYVWNNEENAALFAQLKALIDAAHR